MKFIQRWLAKMSGVAVIMLLFTAPPVKTEAVISVRTEEQTVQDYEVGSVLCDSDNVSTGPSATGQPATPESFCASIRMCQTPNFKNLSR